MITEQIRPDLYRLEISLPDNPLKSINSYLIKGPDRSLIIDTGMNCEECLNPMISGLEELSVDLNKTDFFITHLHVDHIGLVEELSTKHSRIYFNKPEAPLVNVGDDELNARIQGLIHFYVSNGFPEDKISNAFDDSPVRRYGQKGMLSFSILHQGDTIDIGSYSFSCIETPGHSPGHMCLYEPENKILVSGDHILFDITPNITCWPQLGNALEVYLASLNKVYSLNVDLVLPGHRSVSKDHRKRIRELQKHHEVRLNEVLTALADGEKNAWEVAPYISWELNASSLEHFPVMQQWFALGETIAHIIYLEESGKIKKHIRDENITYSMK